MKINANDPEQPNYLLVCLATAFRMPPCRDSQAILDCPSRIGDDDRFTGRCQFAAFWISALVGIFAFCKPDLLAQSTAPSSPAIQTITVCNPYVVTLTPHCIDTHQVVVAPDGVSTINAYAGGGISDEHSSVFPPGSLDGNRDYLFFVASGTRGTNPDIGVLVLSASSGPPGGGWNPWYQWKMDFAKGYGDYPSLALCVLPTGCQYFVQGDVFLAPMVQGNCPPSLGADATFDLNYAAAGSVVEDPRATGHLLMAYDATNCNGTSGQVGIATSWDYGVSWPSYRGAPYCRSGGATTCSSFLFYDLPFANPTQGPQMPNGATGVNVCDGLDCSSHLPDDYGRYPSTLGAEPSAFVDDPHNSASPYIYVVHGQQDVGLTVSRAELKHGPNRLSFEEWNGSKFAIGATAMPVLPAATFGNCSQGSISYFTETKQYVLIFVCISNGDPASGKPGKAGSAWFWSATNNLSSQQWSTPKEIEGSWSVWEIPSPQPPGTGTCPYYKGWYPTFMSLGEHPGHLSPNGYVFYLWGCLGKAMLNGKTAPSPDRQYSSRAFTISYQ